MSRPSRALSACIDDVMLTSLQQWSHETVIPNHAKIAPLLVGGEDGATSPVLVFAMGQAWAAVRPRRLIVDRVSDEKPPSSYTITVHYFVQREPRAYLGMYRPWW